MSIPRAATGSLCSSAGVSADGAVAEFEVVYRANVAGVSAFFARRCSEPQAVADLTSETFVQAVASLGTFDPQRGSARAWLFGIARRVYAQHCERSAIGREAVVALAAPRELGEEEIEELAARIDAQRAGRELLARCARLSPLEQAALELVDIDELEPREAASLASLQVRCASVYSAHEIDFARQRRSSEPLR